MFGFLYLDVKNVGKFGFQSEVLFSYNSDKSSAPKNLNRELKIRLNLNNANFNKTFVSVRLVESLRSRFHNNVLINFHSFGILGICSIYLQFNLK